MPVRRGVPETVCILNKIGAVPSNRSWMRIRRPARAEAGAGGYRLCEVEMGGVGGELVVTRRGRVRRVSSSLR